jgi:hypothetical protein
MKPPQAVPAKKPYESPKLFIYGDLTTMTQTMAGGGMLDGGKAAFMRRTA